MSGAMSNKFKVLYVDDEEINLLIFKINLSKKYYVIIAENGPSALSYLETNPDVSVVISDMKMPSMNGIEFIKKARSKYPSISYYILTGFEITSEIHDALNTGLIKKCFRKPFNLNEVDSVITSLNT